MIIKSDSIDKTIVLITHDYFKGREEVHLSEIRNFISELVDVASLGDFRASVSAALHYYRDKHGLFKKVNKEIRDGIWIAV